MFDVSLGNLSNLVFLSLPEKAFFYRQHDYKNVQVINEVILHLNKTYFGEYSNTYRNVSLNIYSTIHLFFSRPTHEEIESWGESFDKLMQSKGIFGIITHT